HASFDGRRGSQDGVYARLGQLITAAYLACRLRSIDDSDASLLDSVAPSLIECARIELSRGDPIGREHLGLVNALAKLDIPSAYELLWDYAAATVDSSSGRQGLDVDYSVRRAALKAFVQESAVALDICIPPIRDALGRADE